MKTSRLLLIAPMPPLRGGIPLHSHYLAKSLREQHNLELWAPRKLFPNFLYPGGGQFENESEREVQPLGLAHKSLSKIEILIRLLRLSPDEFQAALVPWWTSYFTLHTIAIATVLRLKGVAPAIFCHNVYPHYASSLDKALSRFVVRQFQCVFVQSENEFNLVKSFHPTAKCAILNHPPYPSQPSKNHRNQKESPADGPIRVLFFGFIREYKGIDTLLEAAQQVSRDEFHFHFVGEPWSRSLRGKIGSASENHPHISHDMSYVGTSTLPSIFAWCDVVVLPYSQSTGSGALATAKGMGVPVIISDRIDPGPEFSDGRDGIIFPAGDSARLAGALQQFRKNIADFDQCWLATEHDKGWGILAKRILDTMEL